MTEVRPVAFGDLYLIPSKNGLTAPSKVRGAGALLVNMKEIFAYDRLSGQDMERAPLPSRNPDSWLLEPGDLLFARQSLTLAGAGKVSYVAAVPEPMTFESHIIRVRLDPNVVDSRYYYYYFQSPPGRALMESIVEQVAAAGIRSSDLARLQVPVPPLAEQRRVVGILTALDDLIDHNERLVADLRALSSLVFEHACADGDEIPFGEVAFLVRDGVGASNLAPGTPYLGLEHFETDGRGIRGIGDAGDVSSSKLKFRAGDVLYGKLRPYFRKHDRPGFVGVCSTEVWVLRPKDGFGGGTVDALVSQPGFTEFAMSGSGGTRMPRADWKHVATMPVRVPSLGRRAEVDASLDGMWRAQVALREENDNLRTAKDELLPLLMTGRAHIRDFDGLVA